MKTLLFLALSAVTATPVFASETRQLDVHEHGVGQLNIAFDGQQIAMELHAPGADIVGFEYAAESAKDRKAVDAAVAMLARPLDLFVVADAAGCSVAKASAELESEESHDDHKADHADDHKDDHADEGHKDEEHDHDDHAADEGHKDEEHDHDDHAADEGHKDEEHDHDDHATDAGHTEFHAEYLLECADPTAVTDITFAYFEVFPNALEVEVKVLSAAGATSFEVERDDPVLDLRGMF